ncbi:hypothetical protein Y032_0258g440 [Ancylostoma ceylanicum]|uniref:Peptidase A1 domain-containing protein n=1 Tax=Ancylostoma ceylanicum TaxID=53326 RepID=A0A016SBE5_9BILA|nr:hypothetical protein Y032_0258g440 [Ancylostoma ceylanicum]
MVLVLQTGVKSAAGFYGNDTIRLGDHGADQLALSNIKFGQATQLGFYFVGTPYDGVFGLAFSALSKDNYVPPFEQAYNRRLVDPVFTLFMEKNGGGGAITFGGLDKQHCGGVLAYEKLTLAKHWQFRMNTFSSPKFFSKNGWDVMIDNSYPFLGIPNYLAHRIARESGAEVRLLSLQHCFRTDPRQYFLLTHYGRKLKMLYNFGRHCMQKNTSACVSSAIAHISRSNGKTHMKPIPFDTKFATLRGFMWMTVILCSGRL